MVPLLHSASFFFPLSQFSDPFCELKSLAPKEEQGCCLRSDRRRAKPAAIFSLSRGLAAAAARAATPTLPILLRTHEPGLLSPTFLATGFGGEGGREREEEARSAGSEAWTSTSGNPVPNHSPRAFPNTLPSVAVPAPLPRGPPEDAPWESARLCWRARLGAGARCLHLFRPRTPPRKLATGSWARETTRLKRAGGGGCGGQAGSFGFPCRAAIVSIILRSGEAALKKGWQRRACAAAGETLQLAGNGPPPLPCSSPLSPPGLEAFVLSSSGHKRATCRSCLPTPGKFEEKTASGTTSFGLRRLQFGEV